MATTPRGLVYPGSAAAPNVPADMQALAESVEAVWDSQPFCWVQHNAAVVHTTSGTWYSTPFDTENSDVSGMHSTSSNQTRVVAPSAGLYICHFSYCFAVNATGQRAVQIRMNANNAAGGGTGIVFREINTSAALTFLDGGACILKMAANDYVEMFTYQNSTASLSSVASTATYPYQSLALARFA